MVKVDEVAVHEPAPGPSETQGLFSVLVGVPEQESLAKRFQ